MTRQTPLIRTSSTNTPADSLALERIVTFSDGVLAIAITLLVLDINVPEVARVRAARELPGLLWQQWPAILSYLISFGVIGQYWEAHHRMFHVITRYDRTLIWLNLAFLLCVAFLPFPTELLGRYAGIQAAVVLYAATVATSGLVKTLLWWYASTKHRLIDPALPASAIWKETWHGLLPPLIFLGSIGLSFLSPLLAMYSWLLLIPVGMVRRQWMRAATTTSAAEVGGDAREPPPTSEDRT
jgi:uncharacterized membrane protein